MATRELSITVQDDGRIAVGIYWYPDAVTCQRISGTRLTAWPAVLALVARFRAEHPTGLVFVR